MVLIRGYLKYSNYFQNVTKCVSFSFCLLCRMTLLLGPPGAGKTILLKALAAKLDKDLRVSDSSYCYHTYYLYLYRLCPIPEARIFIAFIGR